MPEGSYGELIPIGGGDPIPLLGPSLVVGRRESADIVLRFPNVSGRHCELVVSEGYWVVRDLGSSNGTKVNGARVSEQRLEPGDTLSVAKHDFEINYVPSRLGASATAADHAPQAGLFGRSLLETAGLEARRIPESRASGDKRKKYDL
jgi:pSer/pThr/pTyr-binding forkhead associated (FHA) protein